MAKLSKAPVFYVVAQVAHSPILKLESLIPDLQERLRKDGFPGYRLLRQLSIEIQGNTEDPSDTRVDHHETTSHIFASRDQTESFVVGRESVAFQTVEYGEISEFREKFKIGISAIREILAPDSFSRVGLRFLDAVLPPDSGELDVYVRNQFLGLQQTLSGNWQTSYTFSESSVMRENRQTKVRVLTRSCPLSFPPDLAPTAPPLPDRFSEINGVHALLDSDASFVPPKDGAEDFEPEKILRHLLDLKTDIRDTFNAVVTEAALTDWK